LNGRSFSRLLQPRTGLPASRVGDCTTCGAKINAGSSNVFIGGQTEATEDIDDEVPGWLRVAVFAIGTVSIVGLVRYGVISLGRLGLGVAGGLVSEKMGRWKGGEWFGEGSDGQTITALVSGAVVGGAITGSGGKWLHSGGRWLNTRRLPSQDRINNAKAVKDLDAGVLPGTAKAPGQPRNMPPSKNPNKTAEDFAVRLFGNEKINKQPLGDNCIGCWKAKRSDGTWVSYRPAGRASHRTPADMASVGISSNPKIDAVNISSGGKIKTLKLKFPSL